MQFRNYRSLLFKFWTLRLWAPFGTAYDVHLRLVGKRVVDFLLVLIELFFARSYGWGATSDYWFKIGDFAPTGPVVRKFQVERVAGLAPSTNHSSSQKTRLNDFSHGIKIWTDFSSVLSQCMRLTDRQTDRLLIARPRLHSMQRGKNWRSVNW